MNAKEDITLLIVLSHASPYIVISYVDGVNKTPSCIESQAQFLQPIVT